VIFSYAQGTMSVFEPGDSYRIGHGASPIMRPIATVSESIHLEKPRQNTTRSSRLGQTDK